MSAYWHAIGKICCTIIDWRENDQLYMIYCKTCKHIRKTPELPGMMQFILSSYQLIPMINVHASNTFTIRMRLYWSVYPSSRVLKDTLSNDWMSHVSIFLSVIFSDRITMIPLHSSFPHFRHSNNIIRHDFLSSIKNV